MKKIILILLVLIVGTLSAQTDNSTYPLSLQDPMSSIYKGKDGSRIVGNIVYTTTMGGAIDTVWQHILYDTAQHDVWTNHFFAASDGSFYFASYNQGGFLTKINGIGAVEWTIKRRYSYDSTNYSAQFENISELPNGDILVYGCEGKTRPYSFYNTFPIRFIISPEGIIKEEKTMRNILPKTIPNRPVYTIFPDTRVYLNTSKQDSISIFSMDTSFTKIQNTVSFNNEYRNGGFNAIRGVLPYDSLSFTVVNSGLFPGDTSRSVTLLRYTKEYELVSRLVIHTLTFANVAIYNDGSYFIMQGGNIDRKFIASKYDKEGNLLWKKQPELLKKFEFVYFEMLKGKNGGFFIFGEIYSFNNDGSINHSEASTGILAKMNEDGECEWYYTSGDRTLRNLIKSFAEAPNKDIVFLCNSAVYDLPGETSMQITRLRPRATGVTEQPSPTSDGISIYPNPTSTTVTISGIEGTASLRIMNSLGMEVISKQHLTNNQEIDVSNLPNGLYFARVSSTSGNVMKPIVVSR